VEKYVCPICGNEDPRYIGYKNGLPYCRRCISFQGKHADLSYVSKENLRLKLSYPLSEKQQEVSSKVLTLLINNKNALIHAVTGAGKTELVYASMEHYLLERKHVGFATPRKDVVIDLVPRVEEAFPDAKVVAVYGEHTSVLNGDIILLTTHQLYRYAHYFDLLILDEIDAFPYKDNALLNHFFYESVKGNYVLLSATPSKEDINNINKDRGEVVSLYERYHHHALPLPVFIKKHYYAAIFYVIGKVKQYEKENKPVFIFVPTIQEGKKLYAMLSLLVKGGSFVSSKEESRRLDIERFKQGELSYLVTTSILERGVTVRNLQVIVFMADDDIYNQATLVQIAGRVGRKINATSGEVIFLGQSESSAIKEAIYEIARYNKKAHLL
jgi:competence protein ComFA